MNFSSADLCKMSVQEVADMLLEKLCENMKSGKDYSCAKLMGESDNQLYELCLVMRCTDDKD